MHNNSSRNLCDSNEWSRSDELTEHSNKWVAINVSVKRLVYNLMPQRLLRCKRQLDFAGDKMRNISNWLNVQVDENVSQLFLSSLDQLLNLNPNKYLFIRSWERNIEKEQRNKLTLTRATCCATTHDGCCSTWFEQWKWISFHCVLVNSFTGSVDYLISVGEFYSFRKKCQNGRDANFIFPSPVATLWIGIWHFVRYRS